jgi:F-type H+-transporting ATPase subunit delta
VIRRFARPYARAIMDVMQSPVKAGELRKELLTFEQARAQAPDLQELYSNPGIDAASKVRITEAIAKRLGLSDMAVKLLGVLLQNHRMNDLGAIIEALATMVNEALDIVVADVRSAHRLDEQETRELQAMLERKVGKRVEIHLTTDPALLGGFVAKLGSEIFDASVAGKIEKFRTSLA